MKPKKTLLIVGAVIVVAVLLCVASSFLPRDLSFGATPQPDADSTEIPTLAVRARGKVVPTTWAALSFDNGGSLIEWLVAEGDVVQAGDVLGRLDSSSLDLALLQAQLDLESAELRLTQAEIDHAQQLKESELALQGAEARHAQSRSRYPSLTAAEVRLQAAIEAEAYAQDEYNKSLDRDWEPDIMRESYYNGLQQAIDARQIAQADYDAARGERAASSQELVILDGDVASAQLTLEKTQQGVDATLRQDVERAKLQVARAEADLAAATLIAPFSGTVVSLHARPHDWVQPGMETLTLADLSTLQVETTDLDEWGIARIDVGDAVEVTFSAFDNKTLSGHVSKIALRGDSLSGGDIVYQTLITLDAPDAELLWGMSVRVNIPVED